MVDVGQSSNMCCPNCSLKKRKHQQERRKSGQTRVVLFRVFRLYPAEWDRLSEQMDPKDSRHLKAHNI